MKTRKFLLLLPAIALATLGVATPSRADGSLQILKFEADWCGPCQKMKPVFEKVSKDLADDASFRTINVDDQPSVADAYGVQALPTVIAVKDGKVVAREIGYMNGFRLKAFVKKNL